MLSLHHVVRSSPLRLSSLRPGIFRSLNTSRPTTWSAKIWFRANGTRRSFVSILVITSLLSGLLYMKWDIYTALGREVRAHEAVSTLVRIQCVDSAEYAGVDFSSYTASLNYFVHLYAFYAHLPLKLLSPDRLLAAGLLLEHTDKRDEAHTIMCEAAKAVHAHLAEDELPRMTGARVMIRLLEADVKLSKLCLALDPDDIDPADKIKLHDVQVAIKDAEAKGPEVLG
ncbi:hypothetical protein B0H12DRAFT_1139145 [Mycena haematopus]|nr:hypothetical protein B0H12DRAFT_1139145 [Mycena haematopus]